MAPEPAGFRRPFAARRQSRVILRVHHIDGARRVGVFLHVRWFRHRFAQHLFDRRLDLGQRFLVRVFNGHRVEQTGFRQFVLEQLDGIGFIPHALGAAGRRMAVQPRDHRFNHVRPALAAAIIHTPANGVPTGEDIVAIDDFAADAEPLAAVDDVFLAVLAARRRRDAPTVVRDDDQNRQFVAGPAAPDQARGEIALGGAGLAAGDNRDAVAAEPFLHQRRARRHDVLHLDHGRDRDHVPIAIGEMAGEIAAHRMRIGGGHGHLPDAVDHRHTHSNESGAVAIVEVKVIVGGSAAFFDLQPQAGVERFLARPADPEVALSRFAHFDHPLFHGSATNHDAVDF